MQTLIHIFEVANKRFLHDEKSLILHDVSERSLCAALKCFIGKELTATSYQNYYVDVEYNRNHGKVKTIMNDDYKVVTVNCDLIVHSRGEVVSKDNLLALEMKKSKRPLAGKVNDRNRLIALTKSSYDGVWSNDGTALPKHVCGYLLGIYYEIDIRKRTIAIEYYCEGRLLRKYIQTF